MKNFFKKLSFVMALAMVLTALAPAVAGADASYIYKRGNDTQNESVAVWFGDADEKRDLNVKINGKKTNDGTWKIGNKAIATIDENGVVTPVKNGTTTAKFTAEDGTVAKVKVVVGTRAAGIKVKDNGEAITELAMTVGEEKELKFGAYISKKAKSFGATKASQEVAFTVEGEAVTTAQDGKYVTVTAAKAGEATITFTAGKKTTTLAVTVINGLAASQTGANKITVTGSDLSDKVADYAVKRGTNTVALASVALNEEKTEAVITTSAKAPVAGKYTVSFKGSDAVEFEMVASKVAKIVFGSETAIMNTATTASITFVVLNQFDENVTNNAYANLAITTSTDSVPGTAKTLVAASNAGVITFAKATAFIPTVDVVVATVVDKTNGVNANGTFTVSQMAQPATVEVLGLYKQNAATYAWEKADLKEGTVAGATYYLALSVKDQYGSNVAAAGINAGNLNVNVVPGLTQVAVGTTPVDLANNGVNFAIGYPVNAGAIKAGTVSVLAVVLTSGNTASTNINVAPTTKVASIELAATDALYVGKEAEIAYTALDAEGNEVTKYDLLTQVAVTGAGISYRWAKQPDGSAKLYMTLSAKNVVVITTTPTLQYKTTTFTAFDACIPTVITGVNAKAVLGAISGSAIEVPVSYLNVEDQYGNAMSATAVAAAINGGNYKIKVTYGTSNAIDGSDAVIDSIANDTLVVDATTDGKGVEQVTISLMHKDYTGAWKDTMGSDATITLKAVELAQCTTFEVAPVALKQSFESGATDAAITVYGYADGTKVTLTPAEYDVVVGAGTVDGKISVPGWDAVATVTEYTKEYTVVIANTAGTELKFNVDYSEKAAVATTATANVAVTQRLVNGTTYNVQDILGFFTIKDQYGNTLSAADLAPATRINVSGYTMFSTVNGNGTTAMTYKDYDTVAHFVITIGSLVYEADIVVY